jgi:hypothetical protein
MLKQQWSLGASASSDPQGFEILIQPLDGGGRSERLTFLAESLPVLGGVGLPFLTLCFHSLRCGKFPVPMCLTARDPTMQFANLVRSRTTGRTGHRECLLHGQFFAFHRNRITSCTGRRLSPFDQIRDAESSSFGTSTNMTNYEQK